MLVVCFGDGLGNQMFQYAFFKSLQKHYPGVKVRADINNFYGSMNEHNGYELERIFGIKLEECEFYEARALVDFYPRYMKKHKRLMNWLRIKDIFFGRKESFITVDDPTVYYKEVFELSPLHSYMFRGNWINEDYFKDVEKELKEDLHFPKIKGSKNKELLEQINNTKSVSIHIRGGDYLGTNLVQLDGKYYNEAIRYIEKREGSDLTYYIFSNDFDYVRKLNLNIKNYVEVSGNTGKDSYMDMQLMSQCKHNIIANSTFSFWGAYLNPNPQKLVVAPIIAEPTYAEPFACKSWHLI